jgi:tetratricopeptide (TPR) repeat protein
VPAEVRQGFVLLGKGLVSDAIRTFRQAVQRYPQSLEAKLGLAIAYRRAGQDANAFRTYEQVLAQDPNNVLALKSIGLLGGYRPEWQNRGIQALNVVLNLNPNDVEARAQRALLLGYQARFAESLADYEIVLRTNATPDVVLGAAQSYTYAGDYPRAIDLFNRYRQSGRRIDGFAAIAYARALRNTGNAAQAVQLLAGQLTNRLNPLGIQTRVELSQAYLANNQPTQALAVLDPLRDRPEATLPLARALNEVGRQTNQPTLTTQAIALYRRALSQTPNPSPALLQEVADVFSGQPQERETALQIYRQLAQAQPNDRGLQIKRLALENQLGYLSKADLRQQLRPLIEPLPTDAFERRAIAQALASIEPDPDLLPVYQALIQTEAGATEPFLNFRLAQILIARNDLVGARNALAAYTASPQGRRDLAPQLLAAEIERREGSLDAAARRYEAVLAANPDADVANAALRGLAGIRLTQGRSTEALQIYDQLVARNPQDAQLQLGRASVAYQAKQISEPEAQAVLDNWLRTRPPNDLPPELYSLVGALPPDARREELYNQLANADPNYIPVQLRRIQVLAARNPAAARAQVTRIFAARRAAGGNDINAALLQGQLAQAVGEDKLADEAYQSVLAQQPDNTDALLGLGSIRLQQRRFDTAEEYYNLALALKPNDVGIRQALIEVTVAQDRPLAAIRQLEELQLEQAIGADAVAERRQKLEEDLLRRRGFQPAWERY